MTRATIKLPSDNTVEMIASHDSASTIWWHKSHIINKILMKVAEILTYANFTALGLPRNNLILAQGSKIKINPLETSSNGMM